MTSAAAKAAPAKTGPRYLQIKRTLEAQIVSGAWPSGRKLPSEPLLAEQFQCARMTVGRAIAELVDAGLLVRRRRAGTFVGTPRAEATVLEIQDIAAEVRAAGQRYDFTEVSQQRRKATIKDAQRLTVAVGIPVIVIHGVHRADGAPIATEERLINLSSVPQASGQTFAGISPGSWLLVEVPWTEAEHQIEAVNADNAASNALGLKPGAACLQIDRRTWRADSSITWVRLTFPGHQHRLTGRFRAQGIPREFPA